MKTAAQFWANVDTSTDCWLWLGGTNPGGYGTVRWRNKTRLTHRVAWRLAHGRWPTRYALHSCDNTRCVRPSHLFSGSQTENMSDAANKNRMSYGEHRWAAKLTDVRVREMRTRYRNGESGSSLAREFGVSKTTAFLALNEKTWRRA